MMAHPSIASSVNPVSFLSADRAAPRRVAASRPNTVGVVFHAPNNASSVLSRRSRSASVVSTVPPTSATSYVSSRSSSSDSKAARAARMAALAGAARGVASRVSAVRAAFLRPMCRREVGTARRSSASLSKTLRRCGNGVERGARSSGRCV